MAKQKFDFTDKENLLRIEGWARDGATDKDIAKNIGYGETYFSTLKGQISELSEALKKGRSPLDTIVEGQLYRKCVGYKQKVQKPIKLKEKYFDKEGRQCEKERVEIVDYEETIFPEVTAQIFWLKNRKSKYWNRQDNEEDKSIPKSSEHGINIDEWIKDRIK